MKLLKSEDFQTVHQNKTVSLFTLRNNKGIVAQITNFGAILASLYVPDRHGNFTDIVLGFDSIEDYIRLNSSYFGAVCGRVANRITHGEFELDGNKHKLAINNGPNHLHGGLVGYDKVVWDVVSVGSDRLEMSYVSPNGEEGYPGELGLGVTYTLNDQNELTIEYNAKSDQVTIVNLTSHSYFDLSGQGNNRGAEHELYINAKFFMPVTPTWEPSGEIVSVTDGPMDFSKSKLIGQDLHKPHQQLKNANGYDHNFVLNKQVGEYGTAAILQDPESGRVMEICTSQPGIQFYSGNYLNDIRGKGGKIYRKQGALCLETQGFPDAINNPHFPSIVLRPGQQYLERCTHRFYIKS